MELWRICGNTESLRDAKAKLQGLRLKKALAWADSVCAASSCRRARAVRRTAAMEVSVAPCREPCAEEQEASSSVWEASPSVITSLKSKCPRSQEPHPPEQRHLLQDKEFGFSIMWI
ncbi:unnamed protein product [Gadus morhua 'NCC']